MRGSERALGGEAGIEYLKPAPNDLLQRRPVSKRPNSSRADANDATLIDQVEVAAGQGQVRDDAVAY
jgi:hypothetical protein